MSESYKRSFYGVLLQMFPKDVMVVQFDDEERRLRTFVVDEIRVPLKPAEAAGETKPEGG